MNIQEKIEETRKRTQLINCVVIDWQYAQQIIPSVLPLISKEEVDSNHIQEECSILYGLFSNIENHIKELKNMIPIQSQVMVNKESE